MSYRVGIGYDVHQFDDKRELVLGGVKIPYKMGLKGHSDADVLLHAIIDAMLGAAALGDIGAHFPDNDAEFKNIDSLILLNKSHNLVKNKGFQFVNLDSTIVAEKPKLIKFIEPMRRSISKCLNCDIDQVSIKATTSEKMGFIGRKEGIAAHVVAMLKTIEA